ncbi:helix-turn-helix domain-containing protein [Methanosarcina sp. KYL-1]|nr:helix-turn-helix domain-containing protein [Methanosarcina sp. KYL-1]
MIPVQVLSLPDEVPLLARALSRPLSMKILKHLREKQMSASELAAELGLRLNTLKYNLDALEEAGLIRVKVVRWSCKGRKIKVYTPSEQPILLLPGAKTNENPSISYFLEEVRGELCRG